MPDLVMCALTSSMDTSFLWKIPAASAAAAPVLSKTSLKCSGEPAPLEAITGMVTASDTALTSSRSKPSPLQHKKMSQAFGGEGRGFIHTLICTFLSRSGYELVKTSMAATYTKSGRGTHCPSLSMQFSRISPAPRASTALASSTASMSRPSRPPFTVHSHL